MNLDFWGTGEIAAEQDCGFQRIISRPSIVTVAEGMLETWQHPIQIRAQIDIPLDGFSGRQRLEV